MSDLTTVRGKVQDALDEADLALGNQTTTVKLSALQAQVTTLTGQLAAAQAKIDAAKAALA